MREGYKGGACDRHRHARTQQARTHYRLACCCCNTDTYTVALFFGSGPRFNRCFVAHALCLLLVVGIFSAKHGGSEKRLKRQVWAAVCGCDDLASSCFGVSSSLGTLRLMPSTVYAICLHQSKRQKQKAPSSHAQDCHSLEAFLLAQWGINCQRLVVGSIPDADVRKQ